MGPRRIMDRHRPFHLWSNWAFRIMGEVLGKTIFLGRGLIKLNVGGPNRNFAINFQLIFYRREECPKMILDLKSGCLENFLKPVNLYHP